VQTLQWRTAASPHAQLLSRAIERHSQGRLVDLSTSQSNNLDKLWSPVVAVVPVLDAFRFSPALACIPLPLPLPRLSAPRYTESENRRSLDIAALIDRVRICSDFNEATFETVGT